MACTPRFRLSKTTSWLQWFGQVDESAKHRDDSASEQSLHEHGVDLFRGHGYVVGPNQLEVNGTIPITFDDWGIPNPSFGPISTENHGEIELLVVFERAS